MPSLGRGPPQRPHLNLIHPQRPYFFFSIYLFLAALGLRCYMPASSSCGERGLLMAAASPAAEHQLQGSWAQLLRGTWDLLGPGIEPLSPALAGGFPTTGPPGKSCQDPISEQGHVRRYEGVGIWHIFCRENAHSIHQIKSVA